MYVSTLPALNPLLPLQKQTTCALPYPFCAEHKTYAYLTRGLIYHLFRALNLAANEVVLVPDYHHGNEVRAIRAAGATPRFYRVDRDLQPDFEDLERCATANARAMFVIHYNGWAQPIDRIAAFCRERGMTLIEDCALAMFSQHQGRPLGTFGDYSLFCLYKFLPVPHGGLLVQNTNIIPALQELELHLCDRASVTGRALELMIESVSSEVEWLGKSLSTVKRAIGEVMSFANMRRAPVGDQGFDIARANLGMAPITRHLLERLDYDQIPDKRRALYSLLWSRLVGHASLLDLELNRGVCPLFFPMLVADKKLAVEALRAHGIGAEELWNHGDPCVDPDRAKDARFLREHLIEIPLHQDMTHEHVEYIARTVKNLRPLTSMTPVSALVRARATKPLGASRIPAVTAIAPLTAFGGGEEPELTVETLRGTSAVIDALAEEWSELCDEGPCDDLFFRPEWIKNYLAAFEPDATLIAFAVRSKGRLRGVLPLIEERSVFCGLPVRRLRAPVNVHSCRFDLIHGTGDKHRIVHALWNHLKTVERWDMFEARDVPSGGMLEKLLELAGDEQWPNGQWQSMRSPFVRLADVGAHGLPSKTSSKFRANLRRRLRHLQALGEVTMERVEHPDAGTLHAFYEMEKAGWKGDEGSAIDCNTATRKFYDGAAALAERMGRLSMFVLRLGGKPIAIQFGVSSAKRYFINKPAYDETYAQYSPGQLLMQMVLEDLKTRGFEELDFLGLWMPWKGDWTDEVRTHAYCYIFHKGAYGSFLQQTKFRFVPFAKQQLRGRVRSHETPHTIELDRSDRGPRRLRDEVEQRGPRRADASAVAGAGTGSATGTDG